MKGFKGRLGDYSHWLNSFSENRDVTTKLSHIYCNQRICVTKYLVCFVLYFCFDRYMHTGYMCIVAVWASSDILKLHIKNYNFLPEKKLVT